MQGAGGCNFGQNLLGAQQVELASDFRRPAGQSLEGPGENLAVEMSNIRT